MKTPLYANLARLVDARTRCEVRGNTEWYEKHTETIKALVKEHMPSGGGVDNGTAINLDASTPEKLVFHAGYHHMNENGMYAGWTEHTFTVTPSLGFGFRLKISGRDRNEIKEYLHEVFHGALSEEIDEA